MSTNVQVQVSGSRTLPRVVSGEKFPLEDDRPAAARTLDRSGPRWDANGSGDPMNRVGLRFAGRTTLAGLQRNQSARSPMTSPSFVHVEGVVVSGWELQLQPSMAATSVGAIVVT